MAIPRTFVLFVLIHDISIFHSEYSIWVSADKPEGSNCWVEGQFRDQCSNKFATTNQFPKDCLSYFWTSVLVDKDFTMLYSYGKGSEILLNDLLKSQKEIYIIYEYYDVDHFFLIINSSNVNIEMQNLQAFLDQHKTITGLTIKLDIQANTELPPNLSQNFKSYLTQLKNALPKDMLIGVYLESVYFQVAKTSTNPGFAFKDIDSLINYYVIDADALNNRCTADFKNGGVSPVSGQANMTMENLQKLVNDAGIVNTKLLYGIKMLPTNSAPSNICKTNYQKLCKHPDIAKGWCADTLETFYEKGKFIKQNANGFIGEFVDIDDALNDCKCGYPFPAFTAILNGYNGSPAPAKCSLFDRA